MKGGEIFMELNMAVSAKLLKEEPAAGIFYQRSGEKQDAEKSTFQSFLQQLTQEAKNPRNGSQDKKEIELLLLALISSLTGTYNMKYAGEGQMQGEGFLLDDEIKKMVFEACLALNSEEPAITEAGLQQILAEAQKYVRMPEGRTVWDAGGAAKDSSKEESVPARAVELANAALLQTGGEDRGEHTDIEAAGADPTKLDLLKRQEMPDLTVLAAKKKEKDATGFRTEVRVNIAEQENVQEIIDFETRRSAGDNLQKLSGGSGEKLEYAVNADRDTDGGAAALLSEPGSGLASSASKKSVNHDFREAPVKITVSSEEVVEQVVKKAALLVKMNSSEMKIDLQPDFLGKMTIKIVLEQGTVTAKFITDSLQVKHLLEGNLGTLQQALENQGIKVEKTEVDVQLDNNMFNSFGGRGQELWHQRDFSPGYDPKENWGSGVSLPDETDEAGDVISYKIQAYRGLDGSRMNFLV